MQRMKKVKSDPHALQRLASVLGMHWRVVHGRLVRDQPNPNASDFILKTPYGPCVHLYTGLSMQAHDALVGRSA